MDTKTKIKNVAVLGLALFAMFFGAGNLIFPPVIGVEAGTSWSLGYLAYFIADVGLAMLGVAAMLQVDGDMRRATGSAGKLVSVILCTAVIACIGPLLAIPRCAATSFEMASTALTGTASNPVALAVFSVVFFGVTLFACINPGKVVGAVGKVLTPVLVVFLAVLIIAGIVNPAADAGTPVVDDIVQEGVLNGYQTMDMLASLAFSIIAVRTVRDFGYTDTGLQVRTVGASAAIAAFLLLVAYGGLAYLGATTGQLWVSDFMDGSVNQAGLLSNIATTTLSGTGAIALSIVVLFACLTTAIGLVSSCADYFEELFGGRVGYRPLAVVICVFSAALCNVGLTQIISVSAPILGLVYPVALFLVIVCLVRRGQTSKCWTAMLGAATAFVVAFMAMLVDTFGVSALSFVHVLPFDNLGFGWVVPCALATLIGFVLDRMRQRDT